jgi:tetratricopeptide (TPR) repeat protein
MIFAGALAMAVGMACLPAQAQSGKPPAQPKAKSQEELKAVQAMLQARDPDSMIKAAEDLLTKYADTQFKEAALSVESEGYRSKIPPDNIKAQIYAEQVLALNPANLQSNLTIAEILIQTTADHALNKDEELARAQKCLTIAQATLKTTAKPDARMPDMDWADFQRETAGQIHRDFGQLAFRRKAWDDAIAAFNAAVAQDPQPANQAYLASALQQAGKNAEAIAQCDKVLADPKTIAPIKSYVNTVKAAATKAMGAAAPAAAPAPAPQK